MPNSQPADQVPAQETPAVEPAIIEPTADEARATLAAEIKQELELKYKNEISGLNRKVGEYDKKFLLTKTEEEQKQIESDNRTKTALDKYAKLAAKSLGLDEEFTELVSGSTDEEIDVKLATFSKLKESLEKTHLATIKKLEDELSILKANGAPPTSGNSPDAKIMKRADFDKMTGEARFEYNKSGGKIEN